VFCWGADLYGEWGEGTKSSTAALPHKVMDNIRDVVEVAPGERHMCVRTGSGQIYCAGDGNQGQLGLFPNSESLVPVEIADMSVTSFSRVESGQHHTCAIPSSGQTGVVCWGSNESAQIESPGGGVSPPSLRHQTLTLGDVSAGDRHTCARTVAGEAYCWGANNRLQSGGSGGMAPVGLTVVELGNVAPVTAVTTGSEHSCALDGAGNLYCWGASDKGQRGGNFNDSATGVQVSLPPVSVPILSASADMTCAVTGPDAASELFCWGVFGDTWGADGSTGPSVVSLDTIPSPYLDVAAGDNHACAVVDGMGEPQIYCWGYEDVSGAVTGVSNPMGAFVPPTLVALP
jgi:alpha-tubulin suppressor-like RCC1 family protein